MFKASSIFGFALVFLGGFPLLARADFVHFSRDGIEAAKLVDGFDMAPGNSLAVLGNATPVGGTFQLFYQATLVSVSNSTTGDTFEVTTASNLFQVTVVAGFRETITTVVPTSPTSNTAIFDFAPGPINFVRFYASPAQSYNNLAGTGFTAGTLILEADVTGTDFISNFTSSFGSSNIDRFDKTGTDNYDTSLALQEYAVKGSGSVTLTAAVTSYDSSYFVEAPGAITLAFVNGNDTTPFTTVDPSKQFYDGTAVPVLPVLGRVDGLPLGPTLLYFHQRLTGGYAANKGLPGIVNTTPGAFVLGGVSYGAGITGGPDFQFQSDANASFTVLSVPEPASMVLFGLGAGIFGIAGLVRRKKAPLISA